jgi:hypothetical protein
MPTVIMSTLATALAFACRLRQNALPFALALAIAIATTSRVLVNPRARPQLLFPLPHLYSELTRRVTT